MKSNLESSKGSATPRRKVLIAAGFDLSLIRFRGDLLKALVADGADVVAVAPPETPDVPVKLAAMGVRFRPILLARTGMSPSAEWRCLSEFRCILRDERPDVYLGYTIKPVVHGLVAARAERVPHRVALVTGLGAAFNSPGLKGKLLSGVASLLYWRALGSATAVVVQNSDIAKFFVRRWIFSDTRRLSVVQGSGVDTNEYPLLPVPMGAPVFLLLGRLLRDKGIVEYAEAARKVRSILPRSRFLLVGGHDSNPAAIDRDTLETWIQAGVVEYHPAVVDVRPFLRECTAYVLPSYHEGLPRSTLEAMSTGRAVITTDAIGCRETVDDAGPSDGDRIRTGRNGYLVPVQDVDALAAAMVRLALKPEVATAMGAASRRIVEERFSITRINQQMLSVINAPGVARQGGL